MPDINLAAAYEGDAGGGASGARQTARRLRPLLCKFRTGQLLPLKVFQIWIWICIDLAPWIRAALNIQIRKTQRGRKKKFLSAFQAVLRIGSDP